MSVTSEHRLDGLEPDNLLAFLALLGLLRSIETAEPSWRPRAAWDFDAPPTRPVLVLTEPSTPEAVSEAAASGIALLAPAFFFDGRLDLNHSRQEAREVLMSAAARPERGTADLLASLMSDAAIKTDPGKDQIEATPFCLLFGQGHQHFLDRLAAVPNTPSPPVRGRGRNAKMVSPAVCLSEALFQPWGRPDETPGFRWDPAEDVRYALNAKDPSSQKTTTQHGANRLAAIGLAALTVVPIQRGPRVRLRPIGGHTERSGFAFTWPLWRTPASLTAIRALLAHPDLSAPGALARLGVVEVREARRLSVGKFMNFTHARSIDALA